MSVVSQDAILMSWCADVIEPLAVAVDKFEMVGHADIALLDKPMLTLVARCTGLLDTESLMLTANRRPGPA